MSAASAMLLHHAYMPYQYIGRSETVYLGPPGTMSLFSCTPSMSLTSPNGIRMSTADHWRDSEISDTTLMGGRPGAR